MSVVTVLHHLESPFLGHVSALGLELDERDLRRGDPLPVLGEVDGIVSLGGEQFVGDPTLEPEVALLSSAVAAGVPVLGICLGAQLLTHALGGRVWNAGRRLCWRTLPKLEAAWSDPLLGDVDDPVLALNFNRDVFALPPGAVPLIDGENESVEAFRHGRAWGIQFHPDVDEPALAQWMRRWPEFADDAFREASRASAAAQAQTSAALFEAFARVVNWS